MDQEQKRALFAVILSGFVLFTWQYFFTPKPADVSTQPVEKTSIDSKSASSTNNEISADKQSNVVATTNLIKISDVVLNNKEYSVTIDSDLNFKNFKSSSYSSSFPHIVGEKFKFSMLKNNELLTATNFSQLSPNEILVDTNKNFKINFNLNEKGNLQYKLIADTSFEGLKVSLFSEPAKSEMNKERKYLVYDKEVSFTTLGSDSNREGKVNWFGIDHDYHIFVMILNDSIPAKININDNGKMDVDFSPSGKEISGEFVFTRKNYDQLLNAGNKLELSVDFGALGVVAVPILRGLQFFYKYIPNYGLSIIILTILIRLLTFPLQYKSFVSMKKMQVLQPELNKLKEKYKEDPQRMQKETMELFKRTGANPLGGCLPMILQMPIFFAFYKVLYEAVELVGSPFYGWIHDLSIKDPFFVLPVLMVILMVAQQKLTPTTTVDPTQQKIMMFMPLVFGFIMKDLPSGLVLYICVSTFIGILQQMIVFKTAK